MAASSSSNGGVPPGFRFHPTDEELLQYYLKEKASYQKFDMEVIREVDLNKIEPWELQDRCRIGSGPQNEWYLFSHKDKKYPTGSRTNRATNAGFWKATGRDKCIRNSYKKIGMRKTLVFYKGRAPHGQKTDWIMHEYRLEDSIDDPQGNHNEEGWVVCRVFKKKNLFKVGSEGCSSIKSWDQNRPVLNNDELNFNTIQVRSFMHRYNQDVLGLELNKAEVGLQTQTITMPWSHQACEPVLEVHQQEGLGEWAMLDRLVNQDSLSTGINNNASSVQPAAAANLLSLRGEMDFWG